MTTTTHFKSFLLYKLIGALPGRDCDLSGWYSGPQQKQTWRRKIQNDRRLGTVGIFPYYENNLGRILNNITTHGNIKQNRCQPW